MNRKLILFTGLLLVCGLQLRAQGRHEINVFVGGYKSEFLKVDSESGRYYNMLFDEFDDEMHIGDLYDLYEPHYLLESGPVVTLNYHYIFNKWVRVGAQANLGALSGKFWYILGNKPAETFKEVMVSVLPEVKINFTHWPGFRLYGKAAVGMQLNMGKRLSPSPVGFAWDVVPIGAEWGGHRIYGNAELCLGSVIQGGRIGLGFKF